MIDSGDCPPTKSAASSGCGRHEIDAFIDSVRIPPGSLRHLYNSDPAAEIRGEEDGEA